MKTADIAVFSLLKRGAWLSNHLSQVHKKKVIFVDLFLEDLNPEDQEGPFGFFLSHKMDFLGQEWWKNFWTPCPNGFSVLSETSFLHFKSTLLEPVYKKRKDYQALQEFQKDLKANSLPFKEGWLVHLNQVLSHCVEQPYFLKSLSNSRLSSRFKNPSHPSSFFQDFGVVSFQEPTPSLLHKEISYLPQKLFDFQIKKRKGDYIIMNNREILIKTQKIVWMLSPAETYTLNPILSHSLFRKYVEPSSYWQRFTFHFNFENYPFPHYFVCANPSSLPWYYENFICSKKSLKFKNQLNTWVKIPIENPLDLEEIIPQIKEKLLRIFPYSQCEIKKERRNSLPFLFPTYDLQKFKKMEFNPDPNIFLAWPYWDMSWNGWAQQESHIVSQLVSK